MPRPCPVPAPGTPAAARCYICACVKVRARRVVLDRRPRTQERADAIQNMAPKGLGGTLHQTHLYLIYPRVQTPNTNGGDLLIPRAQAHAGAVEKNGTWTAVAELPFLSSVFSDTASQYHRDEPE